MAALDGFKRCRRGPSGQSFPVVAIPICARFPRRLPGGGGNFEKSIVLYLFRLNLAAYDVVANMQDFGMPKGIWDLLDRAGIAAARLQLVVELQPVFALRLLALPVGSRLRCIWRRSADAWDDFQSRAGRDLRSVRDELLGELGATNAVLAMRQLQRRALQIL